MPFEPLLPLEPCQKWGLDYVGPFKPTAIKTRNRYIIELPTTARNGSRPNPYWITSTTKFLYENICCRLKCPIELVNDQGTHLIYKIVHELSTYYAVV